MAAKLMKALRYDRYGGGAEGLKHVEIPIPTPKKNEVLLKLEAASLNPADWKYQKGMVRPFLPGKFPFRQNGGGLAEYAVASKTMTVKRPPEVSASEGAALPIAGVTALEALTKAAERNVLITAASGGVGHFAVQLAKLGNIHVTATCGARNIELVKSLGADESPSGRKYDAAISCATNIPWPTFEPNLSENGKVIYIAPGPMTFLTYFMKKLTFSKKVLVPLLVSPKGENLECMVGLVRDGKIKAVIDSKFPLAEAKEAWAKIMDGHATRKIIVTSE
ncbi:hypothetical protein AMTRI_Chr06g172870 [Amborella trichopoda]